MHTLPLFYPTPCMPSPYSIPPHAYPPRYSIPAHACPPPILSQPMHTLPLLYPSPCIPSPYSIPAHAHPPPILCQPIGELSLVCPLKAVWTSLACSIPFPLCLPSNNVDRGCLLPPRDAVVFSYYRSTGRTAVALRPQSVCQLQRNPSPGINILFCQKSVYVFILLKSDLLKHTRIWKRIYHQSCG